MRVERFKNFISEQERLEIVSWFDNNLNNPSIFQNGLSRGEWGYSLRKTTRQQQNINFPKIMFDIFDRIIDSFTFTGSYHKEFTPSNDGLICVVTFNGGDTYKHKDPANCAYGNSVIRFNILIQKPQEGGVLSLYDENNNEIMIDVDEKELYCCNLSDYEHSVSQIKGNIPRYICLFSICCPNEDWQNFKINYKY